MNKPVYLVVVGHKDHGKSTLIGRLLYDTHSVPKDKILQIEQLSKKSTGNIQFSYFLDQFHQERSQNITIDTSQIFFRTDKQKYIIIDVPGHREFIKNMLSGSSYADLGLLVVDVCQGVQEQTRRHLFLLSLLMIRRVIVLINKMDLADFSQQRFISIKKEIENLVVKLNISVIEYIPGSAYKGDNIAIKSNKLNWFTGHTLLELLDNFAKFSNNGEIKENFFIFPVQDIYKIAKKKIIVGRVEQGNIRIKDKLFVLPARKFVQVSSLKKYPHRVKQAWAGENIGLELKEKIEVKRGYIFCKNSLRFCKKFYAHLFWFANSGWSGKEKLFLRILTQQALCKQIEVLKKIDSSTLEELENNRQINHCDLVRVCIDLEKPIVAENYNFSKQLGRFVLVKEADIVAFGIINKIN